MPAPETIGPRIPPAKLWDGHVGTVEALSATPGFQQLRDRIVEAARVQPGERVLDVGAGTGLLALALAARGARVAALDSSAAMCERLEQLAGERGLALEVVHGDAARLPFADGSFAVVVSNYCFHHLRRDRKLVALAEVKRVLVPGGRLVFGDMMFSFVPRSARDGRVAWKLVRSMLAKGPAGIARLVRNVGRLAGGRGEHPEPPAWWRGALERSGFCDVELVELEHEGGVAFARRPA